MDRKTFPPRYFHRHLFSNSILNILLAKKSLKEAGHKHCLIGGVIRPHRRVSCWQELMLLASASGKGHSDTIMKHFLPCCSFQTSNSLRPRAVSLCVCYNPQNQASWHLELSWAKILSKWNWMENARRLLSREMLLRKCKQTLGNKDIHGHEDTRHDCWIDNRFRCCFKSIWSVISYPSNVLIKPGHSGVLLESAVAIWGTTILCCNLIPCFFPRAAILH